ncbi:DNA-binding protein P3A2-like [Mercenaria mercenaria]|uniref:DNA-binding protein P3A2-like n=1 Tax=Mercenaria mercenaria TaxID=6596 RepID=UPI00234FA405|nr:DNA-binding protein P3A2-like [Mercenaria mercenaria]XP_045166058.2 DNA-binding protein P3A2-like [Mercenaria mercenaria]XP_045166059.2 DNA-binding protein P3A2-like [Mercenaria mercenaria]XP_045166061.2 DNA-binding protein P3A2-like [Mercenaria mercenaria]
MNSSLPSSVHNSVANTITINTTQIDSGMISDGISEPSSPDSTFDASELIGPGISRISDDVTSQLEAAGPVGIAAAAAINSGRHRKRNHMFETNPSVRKRQQTRLLRKLKACIEEYTTRVGQQAVVLCCTPSKSTSLNSYKVFGSQPLENVMKNCKTAIMQDLDEALAEQAPPNSEVSLTYDLPALTLDGIPTPVDKMTQAQLRTFIPEMLKYSTGRSKPGWGKNECRPTWWPNDVPWANVRSDVRTEEEKKRVSWTEALRAIVKNCYKHHGREDLLNIFGEGGGGAETQPAFLGTMVQTINNPDGTVSIIQIDTGPNSVVTLPDGTQATVVHSMTAIPQENINHVSQDAAGGLQAIETTLATQQATEVQANQVGVEMPGGTPLTISGGRLVLANGETAPLTTDPATGMMTIPVSIYQSLMASQQQGTLDLGSTGQVIFTQAATTQQVQQPQIITQQQLEQLQQQTSLQQHLEGHQGIVQETDPLGVQLAQQQIQAAGGDSVAGLITAGTVVQKTDPS